MEQLERRIVTVRLYLQGDKESSEDWMKGGQWHHWKRKEPCTRKTSRMGTLMPRWKSRRESTISQAGEVLEGSEGGFTDRANSGLVRLAGAQGGSWCGDVAIVSGTAE